MKPRFLSFEGSEGCGKSTQIQFLNQWLTERGHHVICLREPGGTPLGECVRDLVKHNPAGQGMEPESELLLFAASRAELVRKKILPALAAGSWVICDRFMDSTTVYQGLARQLDANQVAAINHFVVGSCLPSLTFVLDLEPELARARMLERARTEEKMDRMESEPLAFYQAVAEGYQRLVLKTPDRMKLIPATGSRESVFLSILKELTYAFPSLVD
ncbi:MAG: dTMP kinase [Blastochloris sp.]|nr:dTMP kinase [Blastochloris sp.]